ncbi:cytochrome ubiquinol oxidase subunit I [Bailinhaonella thermotolerans]|uniref:Cytochrome ubiquinol oxidase subunit I n=1 Tax=Bailinhaonella thermotolerans TaxID=1070861 RepID=A0A3A4ASW0_9ACTN|nr:cytochrome ubiquinol oxidase subunit I [Bailinhaonella thermotolerans]RJL31669.1 cytochrome ubiquinol oxidase subunit I [Bailinhaonella thermotolerans]
MDALELSRLQFALTTSLHFLFVVLTLGLAPLVAIMQTRAHFGREPVLERMTRFWGQIYVINYALGIFTGLVMEFQFGMNWSGLSHFAGEVFGAPLALETLVAFFLESTFLGLWIFGWNRIPRGLHLTLIWLVTLTAYASAFWIMVANSFLQNPVGSVLAGDRLKLVDFGALLTNPNLGMALGHVIGASMWAASFVIIGVSAYHFLRRTPDPEFFVRSTRLAATVAILGGGVVVGFGYAQFGVVGGTQPGKFDTVGDHLSLMMALGNLLALVSTFVLPFMLFGRWYARRRLFLRFLILLVPLPFAASILGWLVREIGRQPWLVYGRLTVADAVSPGVTREMVLVSLVGFTAVLGLLALIDWFLIMRAVRRGPGDVALGAPPPAEADRRAPALTF